MSARVIWQYWETLDGAEKPAYIDGLHTLAKKNAGVEVILVTPETLPQFVSGVPADLFRIKEISHKSDMIRTMLAQQNGGMWLDVDSIVLRRLDWIFDLLDSYDFVCFNDGGELEGGVGARSGCFASRPRGRVVSEWARQQQAKFPRVEYAWTELARDLLYPICRDNNESLKVLPWEEITPVDWFEIEKFTSLEFDASAILRDCYIVMLFNQMFKINNSPLRTKTIEQIASGDYLLSAVMRHAMNAAGMTW